MAIADLAVSAQGWVEDEFRDRSSPGVQYLRDLAGDVGDYERILVHHRTGDTARSVHVEEVEGPGGIIEEHVASRNPQTSVLNARAGLIRNPGPHTRAPLRSRGTGTTVRRSLPFAREALLSVTVIR